MIHMTTNTASAPTIFSLADRAAAGRRAIENCPTAFDDLQGEGDRELVDHAAASDENVNAALDAIGEIHTDQAHLLGQYLAEQLVEDAIEAEYRKQLGTYRSEHRIALTSDDAAAAYEPEDPKHPDFLNRLGV